MDLSSSLTLSLSSLASDPNTAWCVVFRGEGGLSDIRSVVEEIFSFGDHTEPARETTVSGSSPLSWLTCRQSPPGWSSSAHGVQQGLHHRRRGPLWWSLWASWGHPDRGGDQIRSHRRRFILRRNIPYVYKVQYYISYVNISSRYMYVSIWLGCCQYTTHHPPCRTEEWRESTIGTRLLAL